MQKKLNEDFIEKYSEQFAAKISEDFYASHEYISGQEILNVSPSKQVNFFVIKLLFNNWQQESQRLESPFFNYGAIEVKEALLQFMNVLSRFIQVERKEFEVLLRDAIRDTLFLLMSPNVYLEIEFDRKGAEELNSKIAKNILKYIKIAKPDFSEFFKSNIGVDKDDLEINDGIITDTILEDEIAKLNEVIPLTRKKLEEGDEEDASEDLLNVDADDLISTTIARSSETKEKTEKDPINETQDENLEVEEITKTEETSTDPEETEDKTHREEQGQSLDEINEVEIDVSVKDEAKKADTEHQVEDHSEPQKEVADETVKEEIKNEPSEKLENFTNDGIVVTNMDPGEENDDDDTLNDKFEDPLSVPSIAESHEGQTDSMMAAISVNHRYMFINELFDGEADLFTKAINNVENSSSFDESVEILVQNYAKDYHWDMNSDEVKELLKIIFRRFR